MQNNTWAHWPPHPAESGQLPSKQTLTTTVTVVIQHDKPIEGLAEKVAARAWSIDGVQFTDVAHGPGTDYQRVLQDIARAHAEEVRLGMHQVGSPA